MAEETKDTKVKGGKAPRKARRSQRVKAIGNRYSDADKNRILAAAKREGLTGAQVQKRFGVAQLTFYRWRGPVRAGAVARVASGRPAARRGRPAAGSNFIGDLVRSEVQKVLPTIIQQEIASALKSL